VLRLSPREPHALEHALAVCRAAGLSAQAGKLRSNWLASDKGSALYAAYADGAPAAVAAFIAHELHMNGTRSLAYQSCWNAVVPSHRNSLLFPLLLRRAGHDFRRAGARFLFGFPNHATLPYYARLRGARIIAMKRVLFPAGTPPAVLRTLFDADVYSERAGASNLVRFDQQRTRAWKRREHAGLHCIERDGNGLWGRVATRRGMRVLLAGGCELVRPQAFAALLREAGRALDVSAVRFVVTEDSPLAAASRIALKAPRTEPFTWFPASALPDARFDAHTGLKDAW
jgi:hypothetical protein